MRFPAAIWWAAGVVLLSNSICVAQIDIGSGLRVDRPAGTLKHARDRNVVKQRLDYSCGAAALATLVRYGLGGSISEGDVLDDLFRLLPEDEKSLVRRSGFSLLHLQRVAQQRGYEAAGFRLSADQLTLIGGPVIAFVQPRGYRHFAVLRGVRGDRVYLADPSRGNIRMPAYRFLDEWLQADGRGVIFVVEPKDGLPAVTMPLSVPPSRMAPPERMTITELMGIGGSLAPVRAPVGAP